MRKNHQNIRNYQAENQLFLHRIIITTVIALCLALILFVRLYYLQVNQHKVYSTLSQENRLSLMPLAPNRGLIYDRNGVLLAENSPVFSLDIIPDRVKNLKTTIAALQRILPISQDDVTQFYKLLHQKRRFEHVPLLIKLTPEQVAKFSVNQYRFPGVAVEAQLIRYYPLGASMVDVLGYVGRINEQELAKVDASNYSATNYIGKVGVEKYFESALHGSVGYQQIETDANGQVVRVLARKPPIPGENIYLTIDSGLQIAAEKALGTHRGAVVAIQPSTGQVLALVSNPSYDPNLFVTGISNKQYQALANSPAQPLYNRAIRGQYPLGSTIKPFIALEGLCTHTVTPSYRIYDRGWFQLPGSTHIYRDWKRGGHGWINLPGAIMQSCDTYFYNLAVKLGIKNIDNIMQQFGFGQDTGIQMNEELPGLVPSPAWKRRTKGTPWYTGDTVISGIGQGYMLATPIQLAQGVATIAERGQRYQPNLVLKYATASGDSIIPKPIAETPVNIDPKDWNVVIRAMEGVTENPYGTAYRHFGAYPPKYSVAGKTGTAQVYSIKEGYEYDQADIPVHLRDHSLFIGFAPVDQPQIAIAVIVENSSLAVSVARKVLDYYFRHPL